MPPKARYSRNDIALAAFELTRINGIEAVNARSLAKALGCSTQPLFHVFQSMEEIRGEVLHMAWDHYAKQITESFSLNASAYKATGIAYIRYAHENPQLFKLLFMRDRSLEWTQEEPADPSMEYVLSHLMKSTGLNREQASRFHGHLWNYVHGLAAMIATRFIPYDIEKIDAQLSEVFEAMKLLYLKKVAL